MARKTIPRTIKTAKKSKLLMLYYMLEKVRSLQF